MHEVKRYSNPRERWTGLLDEFRPPPPVLWESFRDFNCPGCGAPARILYEAGEDWKMGLRAWMVDEIVEVTEWNQEHVVPDKRISTSRTDRVLGTGRRGGAAFWPAIRAGVSVFDRRCRRTDTH